MNYAVSSLGLLIPLAVWRNGIASGYDICLYQEIAGSIGH